MRHRNHKLRLTQKPAHARMLKRNLVTSILLYESIRTTKKRAQVIQPIIDRLITIAKTRPAHIAIRRINQTVTDKNASRKIMEVYTRRFANRSSGMTRMKAAGARIGDGAALVDLSFVEGEAVPEAPQKEQSGKKKEAPKKAAPKKKAEKTVKESSASKTS